MATRRKYDRVVKEQAKAPENEIRVSMKTMNGGYVSRAIWLLSKNPEEPEKTLWDTVVLSAIEGAIPKAIIIAEVVRRRIPGLY